MVPLASLSPPQRQAVLNAPFRHYFPWWAVYKASSVSTPVRMVVDPSATGLNIVLAKGINIHSFKKTLLILLHY
jgi:hypothetical protein